MTRFGLFFGVIFAASASQLLAQQATREERLKQFLERFPQADENRDGELTMDELRSFQTKRRESRTRAKDQNVRVEPTHENVKYGSHPRHVIDLYLAKADAPTPLIIYIHGGGFVGGDKSGVNGPLVKQALEDGISFASINYRYATNIPFPAQQHDAARAVQFLRANAEKYNLDKQRFAAFGGSAGAGLSMWLGFHDDLADPESDDPVERESTRLVAVGSIGGQSTYDPNVIKEWIGGRAYQHPSMIIVYDLNTVEQMTDPSLQPLYDEVSAITHLTKDDPPIYMIYSEPNQPVPADARPGQGIHHPIFGQKLIEELKKLDIDYVYIHTRETDKSREDIFTEMLEFLKKQF